MHLLEQLVTVVHDFQELQGTLWLDNNVRAQRALGIDTLFGSFPVERPKYLAASAPEASISTSGTMDSAASVSQNNPPEAAKKKRKFVLKASIPSKRPAGPTAESAAVASSSGKAQPAAAAQSTTNVTPADEFWKFLNSKVPGCDKLWAIRLEVGSERESFSLPPWHAFRFMSTYQFMPTVVMPDVLRRGAAYVLVERPEHKYILCSQRYRRLTSSR